jgi:hypothetical protein
VALRFHATALAIATIAEIVYASARRGAA